MSKYVGVPDSLYRDIVEHFERQENLAQRLKDARVFRFSFGLDRNGGEPEITEYMQERPPEILGSTYVIGKGRWKYADVVVELIPDVEFSFTDAYRRVKPRIRMKGSRPKDSMRVALDRDKRFERIKDRDELWYRRVDLKALGG